jgi:hypothetical protein
MVTLESRPLTDSSEAPKALWTPRLVAVATLLFGFPAGFVLASINLRRMGLNTQARNYLLGGIAGALVFGLVLLIFRPGAWPMLALAANLFAAGLLYRRTAIYSIASPAVKDANALGGILISLGVLLGYWIASIVGLPLGVLFLPARALPPAYWFDFVL